MRLAPAVVAALLAAGFADAARAQDCGHDRAALLAMPFETFDQDLEGGWRPLADIEACIPAAANLIAAYRAHNVAALTADQGEGLRWHEGQLRAASGQTEAAIALFRSTREDNDMDMAYRDATIAFLAQDMPALRAARERLAAIPKPEGFEIGVERAREEYGDDYADSIRWPLNLGVVDGFIACFDKPYLEAYSNACRPET